MKYIDIVFKDISPYDQAPVYEFVEVENDEGASLSLGEWVTRDDGYSVIRLAAQIENQITYWYGVNRPRTISGIRSHADLQRIIETDTMGPVNVIKKESRVVLRGPWKEEQ